MYKNLLDILRKKKITIKDYAEFLGVAEKTVQNKIYGRTEFTLGEAIKTSSIIAPEYKLDFIFERVEVAEETTSSVGKLNIATA